MEKLFKTPKAKGGRNEGQRIGFLRKHRKSCIKYSGKTKPHRNLNDHLAGSPWQVAPQQSLFP